MQSAMKREFYIYLMIVCLFRVCEVEGQTRTRIRVKRQDNQEAGNHSFSTDQVTSDISDDYGAQFSTAPPWNPWEEWRTWYQEWSRWNDWNSWNKLNEWNTWNEWHQWNEWNEWRQWYYNGGRDEQYDQDEENRGRIGRTIGIVIGVILGSLIIIIPIIVISKKKCRTGETEVSGRSSSSDWVHHGRHTRRYDTGLRGGNEASYTEDGDHDTSYSGQGYITNQNLRFGTTLPSESSSYPVNRHRADLRRQEESFVYDNPGVQEPPPYAEAIDSDIYMRVEPESYLYSAGSPTERNSYQLSDPNYQTVSDLNTDYRNEIDEELPPYNPSYLSSQPVNDFNEDIRANINEQLPPYSPIYSTSHPSADSNEYIRQNRDEQLPSYHPTYQTSPPITEPIIESRQDIDEELPPYSPTFLTSYPPGSTSVLNETVPTDINNSWIPESTATDNEPPIRERTTPTAEFPSQNDYQSEDDNVFTEQEEDSIHVCDHPGGENVAPDSTQMQDIIAANTYSLQYGDETVQISYV